MEAFLISTGVVALAEIGDKTQLLALVLAAKFRRPVPIILGILAATLVNHALAGAAGAWLAATIGPTAMRWILGLSFIAMAAWTLIPDEYEDATESASRFGVFGTTLIAFFLLEMGDKTQIATIALAARYSSLLAVVMGTTLGMMLANVPAVLLGEVAARKLPMRLVHGIAAGIFLVLGVLVLLGVGSIASLDRRAPTALEPAIGDVTGRPEQDGPLRAARFECVGGGGWLPIQVLPVTERRPQRCVSPRRQGGDQRLSPPRVRFNDSGSIPRSPINRSTRLPWWSRTSSSGGIIVDIAEPELCLMAGLGQHFP